MVRNTRDFDALMGRRRCGESVDESLVIRADSEPGTGPVGVCRVGSRCLSGRPGPAVMRPSGYRVRSSWGDRWPDSSGGINGWWSRTPTQRSAHRVHTGDATAAATNIGADAQHRVDLTTVHHVHCGSLSSGRRIVPDCTFHIWNSCGGMTVASGQWMGKYRPSGVHLVDKAEPTRMKREPLRGPIRSSGEPASLPAHPVRSRPGSRTGVASPGRRRSRRGPATRRRSPPSRGRPSTR